MPGSRTWSSGARRTSKNILQGFRDRDLHVVEIPPSHGNVAAGAAATAAALSTRRRRDLPGRADPRGRAGWRVRLARVPGLPGASGPDSRRRTASRGPIATARGMRSSTPSWPGPRRAGPWRRRPSTPSCWRTCRAMRHGGCTWRSAPANGPRSRSPTSPPTSGRPGGCWPSSSTRTRARTRRRTPTPSQWNTARSAGGVQRARPGGARTMTCPWSQE